MENKVLEIAAKCSTCKDAEKMYKDLIADGMERDAAKAIIKEAKALINASKESQRSEKKDIRAWFAVSDNIARPLFHQFVKEFAVTLKKDYFEDIAKFIADYHKYVYMNDAGEIIPVAKVKKGTYKVLAVRPSSVPSVLRNCFVNYVSEKYGNTFRTYVDENEVIK